MHLSKVAVHIFQSPPGSPRSPSPPPRDEFGTLYIADEEETEETDSVADSYTGGIALGDKTPLYQGCNFYTVSVSNTFQDN